MSDVIVSKDVQSVALLAAERSVALLNQAINHHGQANWLLSGGNTPKAAYEVLSLSYGKAVDWGKVIFALGDERVVEPGDSQANWAMIETTLLQPLSVPMNNRLKPRSALTAEACANDYERQLRRLQPNEAGVPRFDLIWLGVGEDGHTLSLFPDNPALNEKHNLVVAVHNSPKPPPERISLTLNALWNVGDCLIIASGASKASALKLATKEDSSLPIAQAVAAVNAGGGQVTWLVDKEAAT